MAVISGIVLAGCYAAYSCGRWLAEWRKMSAPPADLAIATGELRPLAAALPLAGPWSFGELEWNLESTIVEADQLAARFEALAESSASDGEVPALKRELIELVDALQIRPIKRAGNDVYRLERSDLQALLVTRQGSSGLKTVALAAAYPHGAGRWQLFVLTPPGATATSQPGDQHLLPLPTEARRSGARQADDGRLLLEFVSLDSSAAKLLSQWREAGWEVRPSGLGGPEEFSFLCSRGEELVYAWSGDAGGSVRNLMLVCTGGRADTGR